MKVGQRARFQRSAIEDGHGVLLWVDRWAPAALGQRPAIRAPESSVLRRRTRTAPSAASSGSRSSRSTCASPRSASAHGEEVGGGARRRGRAARARPRPRPWASAASVPASRSRGGAAGERADEVLAADRQQDRAPELVQRRQRRAAPRPSAPGSWRSPGPGRRMICSEATPRDDAPARSARARKRCTSPTMPLVEAGVEQLCLGRRERVHEHQRGARSARTRRPARGRAAR